YTNPLTIRGVGENEGKVFAFAPQTSIKLDEKNEKVFPAHWFEVIKSNHPVDQNASEAEKMKQREAAINDPNKFTLEQVQNGEWAMSVLLSGAMSPSENTEFTGNVLWHRSDDPTGGNITALFTSDKTPVDFFGVTTFDGKNIGLRPFQVLNPADLKKPDKSQILIITIGVGKERLTKEQNLAYLDMVYNSNAEPILVVASTYDPNKAPIRASGTLVDQPSILVLKQIPGNDAGLVFKFDIDNFNERYGTKLWQTATFYIDPKYYNIQNLIWLASFS
ncbi:MAG: hypothetical protein HY022_13620, partial [Chloroflexi bacterium]|nr:hypothetical protein [Chloroflexota bacterium]